MYFRTTAGENREGKKEALFGDDCDGKGDGEDREDGEDGKKYGTLEIRYDTRRQARQASVRSSLKSDVARFMKKSPLAIKSRAPKPEVPRHDDRPPHPITLRHPGEIRRHLSRHALVRLVQYHGGSSLSLCRPSPHGSSRKFHPDLLPRLSIRFLPIQQGLGCLPLLVEEACLLGCLKRPLLQTKLSITASPDFYDLLEKTGSISTRRLQEIRSKRKTNTKKKSQHA